MHWALWEAGAVPERFHLPVNSRQQLSHLRSDHVTAFSVGAVLVILWVLFGRGHEEGDQSVPEMGDTTGFPLHEACPWVS